MKYLSLFILTLSLVACGGSGSVSILPSADEYDQYSQLNPKMDIL